MLNQSIGTSFTTVFRGAEEGEEELRSLVTSDPNTYYDIRTLAGSLRSGSFEPRLTQSLNNPCYPADNILDEQEE